MVAPLMVGSFFHAPLFDGGLLGGDGHLYCLDAIVNDDLAGAGVPVDVGCDLLKVAGAGCVNGGGADLDHVGGPPVGVG